MKKCAKLIARLLHLCLIAAAGAGLQPSPALSQQPCPVTAFRAPRAAASGHAADLISSRADGDLVVGFPNPNEVREITTPLDVDGNIIIVNNGTLRLNGTQLRVRGNVYLFHNGRAEIQGGTLEFRQDFLYQRSVTVANKAAFWLNNSVLNCGGYNLKVAVTDTAVLRYDASAVTAGIATTAVDSYGSVEATGSQQLGEFLWFDHAVGNFSNCTDLLSWLTLPTGSSVTATLPTSQVLGSYAFPDSAASQAGFDYRVRYNGCVGLLWGLMLESGCTAVIRDSELLAVGALFRGSGAGTVTGLVNNTTIEASRYPAQDRDVRFERCSVRVWNFYSFDSYRLAVANSIFGEIIAFGRSEATVQNSLCDGSGGYVGAFDDASVLLVQSQITARLIARARGRIIALGSTINNFIPHAADNGIIALFHSTFPALPTIEAGSAATVISVDEPRQALTESLVPVHGSVRFLAGADVPVHFVSYWLSAARGSNPELELWKSPPSIIQRYRDTIGVWDTRGLTPGEYLLTVHMRLSNDDTISIPAEVILTQGTVSVSPQNVAPAFHIEEAYPQPVHSGAPLTVRLRGARSCTLLLHDMLGRELRRMDTNGELVRFPTEGLVPGMYILTARQGNVLSSQRIQIRN